MSWREVDNNHKYGVAIHNFKASGPNQLTLNVGDVVKIFKECQGWYSGHVKDQAQYGIFPASYIHHKECEVTFGNNGTSDYQLITPKEDPSAREAGDVLKVWGEILPTLFMEKQLDTFQSLKKSIMDLISHRRQIMSGTLPQDQVRDVKMRLASKIDVVNRKLGLDLVPRDANGEMVDIQHRSAIALFQMHKRSVEASMSVIDSNWTQQNASGQESSNQPSSSISSTTSGSGSISSPSLSSVTSQPQLLPTPSAMNLSLSMAGSQSLSSGFAGDTAPTPTLKGAAIKKTSTVISNSLLFEMKNCVCSVGEDTDVYFSLYNANEGRFISEEFVTHLNPSGLPKDMKLLNNMRTLFLDLSAKELDSTVFLVARIVRIGKMLVEDKEKKDANKVRRPFGCAVKDLSDIFRARLGNDEVDDKELLLPVYTCGDSDFYQLHDMLVRKTGKYEPAPKAKGIYVTMKLVVGETEKIRKELLLTHPNQVTKKLGFPEVIFPENVRNDLYLTLVQGEFQQGRKTTGKNVEVAFSVHTEDGEIVKNCISLGSGENTSLDEYQSIVYYHSNNTKWNETVRLDIPTELFSKVHLRFVFRHMSSGETKDKNEKNFSFTWLPLVAKDGTTINDGTHTLDVFKYDKKVDTSSVYLKEETLARGDSAAVVSGDASVNALGLAKNIKESFQIRTLLCSTKLTQNQALLSLLKWRDNLDEIENTLKRITFVGGDEIVKFLGDIFDALFSILDHKTDLYGQLVFNALVFIVGVLADRKYSSFHPVLDSYIQKQFSNFMAHRTLLTCLSNYVSKADDPQIGQQLRATMKALEYIVRFLIQSRLLFSKANQAKGDAQFKEELLQLFDLFNAMMSKKSPDAIIGTQITALQYFPSIFGDLNKLFTTKELPSIIIKFVASVQTEKSKAKLITYKLQFLATLVSNPLFESPEARPQLLPVVIKHLLQHLDGGEELPYCLEILSNVLGAVELYNSEQDIQAVMQLLHPVLQIIAKLSETDPAKSELVSCLIAVLNIMNPENFEQFVASNRMNKNEKSGFLKELFSVFHSFCTNDIFPKDWSVMSLMKNMVMYKALDQFVPVLKESFLDGNNFAFELWHDCFKLCVAFIIQPVLQLEKYSASKRELVMAKYADMRCDCGILLKEYWDLLQEKQIQFVPTFVGQLLEITMVPAESLRRETLQILADMAEREFTKSQNIHETEYEAIDKLDVLFVEGKGDEPYLDVFKSTLLARFNGNQQLKKIGEVFVNNSVELLQLLIEYRALGRMDESKDERASVMLRLLKYFEKIKREENYYRYVDRLRDLHVQNGNFTEAGFALTVFSDHLLWSDDKLPAQSGGKYPAQTQRERKAIVLNEIINYFDTGKAWERAITCCKTLAVQYETEFYDYAKMSAILQREASFFDKIITQPRYHSEYFRVGYYGKGFPVSIRNKEFVYRGDELERISSFIERIQAQYPVAQILKSNLPPEEKIVNSEGQYIQVVKVDPVGTASKRFNGRKVPEPVERYYSLNEIGTFTFVRPVKKEPKTGNEFGDLWTEKTILVTDVTLPNMLRRAEVLSYTRVEISPIENAVDTMLLKNKELEAFIEKYEVMTPGTNVNPFTMALSGVIDAAVNGGAELYLKLFFAKNYRATFPTHVEFAKKLRVSMAEQITILQKGLELHQKVVSEEMRALHSKLEDFFVIMKEKLAKPTEDGDGPIISPSSVGTAPSAAVVNAMSPPPTPASPQPPSSSTGSIGSPVAQLRQSLGRPPSQIASAGATGSTLNDAEAPNAPPKLPARPLKSMDEQSGEPPRPPKPAKPFPGARSVLPFAK